MKKINSDMQVILDAHQALAPLPIESLDPELARQMPLLDRAAASVYGQHLKQKTLATMPIPVGKIKQQTIGLIGDEVLLRIYSPEGEHPFGGWPILVYFHGGG